MKPQYLYRGIKLKYDDLKKFSFTADLKVPYEPIIDSHGRKTVIDGNEYGIYMSDNLRMIESCYGFVDSNDGQDINPGLRLNVDGRPNNLRIPAVSIIYEINTNNLDVKIPWISSSLRGVYNNGFEGDEWISDFIPKENYEIIKIVIGPDWLHDKEEINVKSNELAGEIVKEIVEKRKKRLEDLASELEKLTVIERLRLSKEDMALYRDIYGENGVRYLKSEDIDLNNALDYIKYLLAIYYKCENPNLKVLHYIENLKTKLNETNDVKTLIKLLEDDIALNEIRRQKYIEHQKDDKVPASNNFANLDNMYKEILSKVKDKVASLINAEWIEIHYYQACLNKTLYDIALKEIIDKKTNYPVVEHNDKLVKILLGRRKSQETMDKCLRYLNPAPNPIINDNNIHFDLSNLDEIEVLDEKFKTGMIDLLELTRQKYGYYNCTPDEQLDIDHEISYMVCKTQRNKNNIDDVLKQQDGYNKEQDIQEYLENVDLERRVQKK